MNCMNCQKPAKLMFVNESGSHAVCFACGPSKLIEARTQVQILLPVSNPLALELANNLPEPGTAPKYHTKPTEN